MKFILLSFLSLLSLFSCNRNEDASRINPPKIKTGDFIISNNVLQDEVIKFKTIANGRESMEGIKDGPKVSLLDNGFTHPSILYIPNGFGGYKYWCALTPYFGVILKQPDYTQFENPHVFRSNDGINWEEPVENLDPLDVPLVNKYNPYWSDTNLLYDQNKLYLYYRGNFIPPGVFGDKKIHARAVVVRNTENGIDWSDRKLLYSTVTDKGIDGDSMIASPSFVKNNDAEWLCYDIVYSSTLHPIPSGGNQNHAFLMRRKGDAPDGHYEDYSNDKICSFINKPWSDDYDPWHIDMVKYDNTYFLLVCVGLIGKSHGDALYLAYSKDGINFKVIKDPLFEKDTYKSALVPIRSSIDNIEFNVYRSVKSSGVIKLYNLVLDKI